MKTTIFKTLTTKGKKITKEDLEKKGYKVSNWANQILEKVKFSKEKKIIDLEIVTVSDLGFNGWTSYKDIIDKAKEMGYELCPAEIGPLLRMEYTDQPLNEWLYIAMEPIAGSSGDPRVFHVGRIGGGSWLVALSAYGDDRWPSDHRFVFVSRKSALNTQSLNTLNPESLTLESAIKICKENGYKVYKEL